MPKTTLILLAAITLLAIAGLIFYTRGSTVAYKPTPHAILTPGPQKTSTSIKELLTQDKNLTCQISTKVSNITINGTIYASNKKIRADFQPASIPINVAGHIVIDSNTGYLWTNQSSQGATFSLDDNKSIKKIDNAPDFNERFETLCSSWTPDLSFFSLPGDVSFVDVSQISITPNP